MVLPQNYTEEKYYGTTTESGCTDRVKKLMAMMHDLPNAICLHRARCFTKVYKENWAQPDVIKKAMAVCETLDTLPLLYNEGELIVGVQATKNKAFPIHPEIETGWILQEGGLKEDTALIILQRKSRRSLQKISRRFGRISAYWRSIPTPVQKRFRIRFSERILVDRNFLFRFWVHISIWIGRESLKRERILIRNMPSRKSQSLI